MALTLHDKLGGWNPTAPGVPGTAANWADHLLPSMVPPGKAITKKKYIGIRMMSLTPRLVTGRLFCLCLKFTYFFKFKYLFVCLKFKYLIYVAVPGLSCGTWDLLVVTRELLVTTCGI